MAKTIAAIDMLVKYLEHRIRNIKADTKEAYDIERGEIVDELKQLAERISNIDPIILPRLPKADLQDEVIRNIASAASKRTTILIPLATLAFRILRYACLSMWIFLKRQE